MSLILTIAFIFAIIIFLALAIALGYISRNSIENSIRKELKKQGCTLISINNTNKAYTPKDRPGNQSWKRYVFLGYSSAEVIYYKEVILKTSDGEEITSLVAVYNFLLFFNEVYIQADLNSILNRN